MIRSIRRFLIISLLTSITVASSISAVGNYLLDKSVAQNYLDGQLIKLFSFMTLLNKATKTDHIVRQELTDYFHQEKPYVIKQLLFQIWTNDGKLLLSSIKDSASMYDAQLGFSDKEMNDHNWRVYAGIDKADNNKIIVAELYDLRNKLADDITISNAYILLVTYPLFGILVWIIIGFALRSVTRVTSEISNRASTFLEPVDEKNIPIEIEPLVTELNKLFIRLKLAFERNKRFAADAAHELKTPLAVLKTQAQVAMKAESSEIMHSALEKLLKGVDRSSHMVSQLLTLSRLGQEDALVDIKTIDIQHLAAEVVADLVPVALEKNIEIELRPAPPYIYVLGNEATIAVLIRNIVDNAIRYTPIGGEIIINIANGEKTVILQVIDSGPGIAPELRSRVFERFYRILGTTAPGSGLGLAIVTQIAELHRATLHLETPKSGKGLQFEVAFPLFKDLSP